MLVFVNQVFLSIFLVGKCMCQLCRARRRKKKSSRMNPEPTIKSKHIGRIYGNKGDWELGSG